jgi:2-polyprenyl-3-methyl-5-hydroxy-6-metoxy-1,4-benzoquinol methylase
MRALSECPVCSASASDAKSVGSYPVKRNNLLMNIRFVECARCRHVFTNPQQTWADLEPFYGDYHVFHDDQPTDAEIDQLIARERNGDRINHARIVPGGRYLDVGCGLGRMVRFMSRLGMDAEGVEPASGAAAAAQQRGINVKCCTLEDAKFPHNRFDTITLYDVIEHVPDPIATLRECKRILKPEGEVVINTPNYNSVVFKLVGSTWRGLDLPHHMHLFSPASMQIAAKRADLLPSSLVTQSFRHHVESQIVNTLRRKAFVPARLNSRLGLTKPLAAYLTGVGNSTGRGEAVLAHLRHH